MNTNKVTISLTPEQQEKARYEGNQFKPVKK